MATTGLGQARAPEQESLAGASPRATAARPLSGRQTSALLLLLNHGNKQAGARRWKKMKLED